MDKNSCLIFLFCNYIKHKANTLAHNLVIEKETALESQLLLKELCCQSICLDSLENNILKLINNKHYSLSVYYYPLKNFIRFLFERDIRCAKKIYNEIVFEFLVFYTDQLSNYTCQYYKHVINSFLIYASGKIEKNLILDLKHYNRNKINKNLHKDYYLTNKELNRFLLTLWHYNRESVFLIRNKLITMLISYTGMRASEIILLKKKNIKNNNKSIVLRVTGKGNKERELLIEGKIVIKINSLLDKWEKQRKKILDEKNIKSDLLFITQNCKQLNRSSIYTFVNKILNYALVKKDHNGSHLLRHTYATNVYLATKDIVLVSYILGHENVLTTRHYIASILDKEKLKKIAESF